jgi:hypothetical protein
MSTLTETELLEILADKDKLLAMVPKHVTSSHAYRPIFEYNYKFYLVVFGLSSKMSSSKNRAGKMGFKYNLNLHGLAKLWFDQNGRCAKTGQMLCFETGTSEDKNPFGASIDRVNNSLGYTHGNIRLLAHFINNAKSTYDDETFDMFIESAYTYRLKEITNGLKQTEAV